MANNALHSVHRVCVSQTIQSYRIHVRISDFQNCTKWINQSIFIQCWFRLGHILIERKDNVRFEAMCKAGIPRNILIIKKLTTFCVCTNTDSNWHHKNEWRKRSQRKQQRCRLYLRVPCIRFVLCVFVCERRVHRAESVCILHLFSSALTHYIRMFPFHSLCVWVSMNAHLLECRWKEIHTHTLTV
jgi:hypothetical protein